MSQGEDGHSVEGLIAQDTVEVAESQIKLIKLEQMPEKATFFKGLQIPKYHFNFYKSYKNLG
jgi:hypothetical protein